MAYKEFLVRLNNDEMFKQFVADVLVPGVPALPPYNPSSDNTEHWKYDSGYVEGYRVALSKLGVKL